MKEPFVLKSKLYVVESDAQVNSQVYDPDKQLWVNADSGTPLVIEMCKHDATERENKPLRYLSSSFGETTLTKTHEGADQSGEVVQSTQFGETTITETGEGIDVSESILDDRNAFDTNI